MASLVALTTTLGLLAAPPHAMTPPASTLTSTAGSGEPENEQAAARQAFDRGLEAVASGEFGAAVTAFERAYRLRPHPVTLFNLALALEKAERLPEAWALFDGVVGTVESDAERREVRRHMRAIADRIAIVEVAAGSHSRVCLDGYAMPTDAAGNYRLAIEPGRHELGLDAHTVDVQLTAGEHRLLLLDDADGLIDGRRRGPLMPTMLGVTIGGGALALGLGVGAIVSDTPGARLGLGVGAATSAGLAAAAGVVALLIETRTLEPRGARRRAASDGCPGNPAVEQRLDVQLAPTVVQPPAFADARGPVLVPPPGSSPTPSELPRLRSIVPPRATAQNRPATTSPM